MRCLKEVKMKYIVYKGKKFPEDILIFSETTEDNHAEIAEKLGILDDVISAGFLKVDNDGVHCGESSVSLTEKLGRNIMSRGEKDEKLYMIHNKSLGG
jgi:hypothetical protein